MPIGVKGRERGEPLPKYICTSSSVLHKSATKGGGLGSEKHNCRHKQTCLFEVTIVRERCLSFSLPQLNVPVAILDQGHPLSSLKSFHSSGVN